VRDSVLASSGKQLLADTHGLMVYEENKNEIIGINAHLSGTISLSELEKRLNHWVNLSKNLSERQRICAALLNDSLFLPNVEGQFVLRVSAIEALCDQRDLSEDYLGAIGQIEEFVEHQQFSPEIRKTISEFLKLKKKQSLRQSYLSKLRMLLSDNAAKSFDNLYAKRSAFVHDGQGRGELAPFANEAMDLAVDLLTAELRQSTKPLQS
jgi:hypothetical protein